MTKSIAVRALQHVAATILHHEHHENPLMVYLLKLAVGANGDAMSQPDGAKDPTQGIDWTAPLAGRFELATTCKRQYAIKTNRFGRS